MKPTIHIGDGPYGGPCSPDSKVLCGKTAGGTHGVIPKKNFFMYGRVYTNIDALESYSVYLTRRGIKTLSADFRSVAAESIKMYGYYNSYRYGKEFKMCKECLASEDFGMLLLANMI